MKCIVYFSGARKVGAPFYGWAGLVVEWSPKAAPRVAFGTWNRDKTNTHGGGTVEFEAELFALVLWGANSKQMDRWDKFTHFGFVGLGRDGNPRLAILPEGTNALDIFTAGGWKAPIADDLVRRLQALPDDCDLAKAEICGVTMEIIVGYGLEWSPHDRVTIESCGKVVDYLAAWPFLSSVKEALETALEELRQRRYIRDAPNREAREKAAAERKERALAEVRQALTALSKGGITITDESIAGFIHGDPSGIYIPGAGATRKRLKYALGGDGFAAKVLAAAGWK